MRVIGIYAIKNIATGKMYIGKSIDCQTRFRKHFLNLRRNEHHSRSLQNSYNKHGEKVFIKGAKYAEAWGSSFVGDCGFSALGGVVGLTYPEEFMEIKKNAPHVFYLIPGYGAQGGSGEDAAKVLGKEMCGVVNSSRGIIGAHKGKDETESFAEYALKAVKDMKEDILKWL